MIGFLCRFTPDAQQNRNVSLEPFTDAADIANEKLLKDYLMHSLGLSFMGRPSFLTSTVSNITLTYFANSNDWISCFKYRGGFRSM